MENTQKKGILRRIYDWFTNLTVKGLLGAIFIAFIIIIIMMSASYLPKVLSKMSSSFTAALYSVFVPAEKATMSADKKIISSGDEFTVNFKKGDNKTDGIFTVTYECVDSLSLLSVESSGLKKIDCDKPYYLLNNNSLKIRAITKDESVVRLVLVGSLENNETQKSETVGVVRVTITNNSVVTLATSTNNTTGSNNSNSVNKPTTSIYVPTYYGKPDLAIRVLQVGLLNTANNFISNQTQFSYNDLVGIKFEVRNDGDANTGTWSFSAVLPSVSTPIYSAPTQVSLRPGESIQFTLGFSNSTNQSTGLITINVDPTNSVYESNESNNMLTSTITNTGYNNYYNNNYNYNNGCYVNGMFTYNCLNYNNYNYGNLSVSCYASPNNPDTDDTVRWYVNAYGGDGDYDYDWTGTNNLDSSSKNPTKKYSSSGTKYATVTVTDGDGYRASQTCSIYVYDNNGWDDDEDRAREAIDDAEDAIDEARDEIEEADDDGDDVDDAQDLLDEAEEALDDAQDAFDDEDYDEALDLANEAEDLANDAIDEL